MKEDKAKKNKLKINKGDLAIKIVCGCLAALMIASVFGTLGYYLVASLAK